MQEVASFELGDSATRSQFFWEYVGLDVEEFDGTFIFTSTADLAVNSLETLDGLPTASLPVTAALELAVSKQRPHLQCCHRHRGKLPRPCLDHRGRNLS